MARQKTRDARKENYWRGELARQAGSALSIRRYCRREKISEAGFHWWKRELARRGAAAPASARAKPQPCERSAQAALRTGGGARPGGGTVCFTEIRLPP